MSEEPEAAAAEDGKAEEETGFSYFPDFEKGTTQNTAYRDQNGVQTGILQGNVTLNQFSPQKEPELLVRRTTEDEVEQSRTHFVDPGGFANAQRILQDHGVVVLCKPGTGRSFAARRLLVDSGVGAIVEMSRQRSLGSVRASELAEETGYIWTVADDEKKPFLDWEFEQCGNLIRAAGCRLIIILDHRMQASAAASGHVVELTAPDLVEIAIACIGWHCRDAVEESVVVLKSSLQDAFDSGDPPEKAARAAKCAIRVSNGEMTVEEALAELHEDVETAVARWFDSWKVSSVLEYSMALAVAVMENEPYDRVVTQAMALDEEIREAELPEDKALRPRRVFAKPKDQLLEDIATETVTRRHPRHTELLEETVRFKREGWAAAVLCHVWREYPFIQPILHRWLVAVPGVAARRALCTIITKVPAHEPLRLVNDLASARREPDRRLAAGTLVALVDDHNLLPLVEETLAEWIEVGSGFRKATAAAVYASPFGQRDVQDALSRLAVIGKSEYHVAKDAVVAGVLQLLSNSEIRASVMECVLSWSEPKHRRTGLRPVGLAIGVWLTGCFKLNFLNTVEICEQFDEHARVFMRRVLDDQNFGQVIIGRLSDLAYESQSDQDKADDLVRLAKLAVPDLRWWSRRRAAVVLSARHRGRHSQIQQILRTARKCQRKAARAEREQDGMDDDRAD